MIRTRASRTANRRSRSGFTLVELMTSIGIIIFLLSVTLVAFGPMMKSSGLKNAQRTVRTVIEGARVRAIQQHRRVRFEAQVVPGTQASTKQWWVTSASDQSLLAAGDLGDASKVKMVDWSKLPEFINLTIKGVGKTFDTELSRVAITFGPDGSVVRVVVTAAKDSSESVLNYPPDNPSVFSLRLGNLREVKDSKTADLVRYIDVVPLTGGTVPRDDTLAESY